MVRLKSNFLPDTKEKATQSRVQRPALDILSRLPGDLLSRLEIFLDKTYYLLLPCLCKQLRDLIYSSGLDMSRFPHKMETLLPLLKNSGLRIKSLQLSVISFINVSQLRNHFSSLTKLHLVATCSSHTIDLDPLYRCKQLKELTLACKVANLDVLSKLAGLVSLSIEGQTEFTETDTLLLSDLKELQRLKLDMRGRALTRLALPSLEELTLTSYYGTSPLLEECSSLETLSIANAEFMPLTLTSLPTKIHKLRLVQIETLILETKFELPELEEVIFKNIAAAPELVTHLARWTNLTSLKISNLELDLEISSLTGLTKLRELSLETKSVATEAIAKLSRLERLALYLTSEQVLRLPPLRQDYVGLRSLVLTLNEGTSLALPEDLAHNPQLRYLSVQAGSNSRLSNLMVLAFLPYLEQLDVSGLLEEKDLVYLEKCHQLQRLFLEASELKLVPSTLNQIRKLRLADVNSLTSLQDLSSLSEVTSLHLSSSSLQTSRGVEALTKLRKLVLRGAACSSFIVGGQMLCLEKLALLSVPSLCSLEGLALCSKLRRLVLAETALTELSAVEGMPCLEELELAICNYLTKLPKLATCPRLRSISLSFNACLTDLAGLQACAELEQLTLLNSPVSNFDGLLGCTKLASLSIVGTWLEDLTLLTRLPNLSRLDLSHNTFITNISPLAGCYKLTWLRAYNLHQLQNLEALNQCRQLRYLNVEGCRSNNIKCFFYGESPLVTLVTPSGKILDLLSCREKQLLL